MLTNPRLSLSPERIDKLIQYTLALAGQDDFGQRELGPIHLIKYVYLADLAYAAVHGGETFTGAPWRFYHFGPWAVEVNARVEPAAQAAGAVLRTLPSAHYEGDVSRYSLRDEEFLQRVESELPAEVTSALKDLVHEFGGDTPSLLDLVYHTRPMLTAAPNEYLSFSREPSADVVQVPIRYSGREAHTERVAEADSPTPTERIRERLREKKEKLSRSRRFSATPPPRYDEIFMQGLRALDEAEGGPVDEEEGEVIFSDDIWKSPGRSGSDVP